MLLCSVERGEPGRVASSRIPADHLLNCSKVHRPVQSSQRAQRSRAPQWRVETFTACVTGGV